QRVGVEIVARADGAVEVGRGVADHEVDALGLEVDRGVLPHAAAERLVGIAGLGKLRLLGLDVAMHIAAGGVLGRPYADRVLGDGVEIPDELAGIGVIGAHEAANAVLTAIGAGQDLSVNRGRRHGLAVAERRIGEVGLPHDAPSLGIEREKLRIERGEIDFIAVDRDAAVIWAAAIGRDRTHVMLVVPILLAGFGV